MGLRPGMGQDVPSCLSFPVGLAKKPQNWDGALLPLTCAAATLPVQQCRNRENWKLPLMANEQSPPQGSDGVPAQWDVTPPLR